MTKTLSTQKMSFINVADIDAIIIELLNPFRDFNNFARVNHYYHSLVTNHDLYFFLKKTLEYRHPVYVSIWYKKMFITCCSYNNPLYRHIYQHYNINIHEHNEAAFRYSCKNGHIEVAKYLVVTSEHECQFDINTHYNIYSDLSNSQKNRKKIDIHANNEAAFTFACQNGHLEVAKWLVDLSIKYKSLINIHIENEDAFITACENRRLDIIKWLIELGRKEDFGKINVTAIDKINRKIISRFKKFCLENNLMDDFIREII